MLKKIQKPQVSSMDKDLPMPKYEYQKPANGNYSFDFAEKKSAGEGKKVKVVGLQNLKFA